MHVADNLQTHTSCGVGSVLVINVYVLGHGLPPLLSQLLVSQPPALVSFPSKRALTGRVLCRLSVLSHVLLCFCLCMCFADHVACDKAEEIVRVIKHEIVARSWEVPVVEVLDVCEAEVAHLTCQGALHTHT